MQKININGLNIKSEGNNIIIEDIKTSKEKNIMIEKSTIFNYNVNRNIIIKGSKIKIVVNGDINGNISGNCRIKVHGDINGNIIGNCDVGVKGDIVGSVYGGLLK